MQRIVKWTVIGAFLLAMPIVATAQPATPSSPAMEQRTTQATARPFFSILGVPVGVDAPVASPYCNCAFQTFAGQPVRSREAVAAQATTGAGGIGGQ
ncbi:MAG: hypothetical protein M0Z28_15250 [Rhodospirillales bacterium]|nr:hypothetical protein [Rhodospirillales bacterium]